MAEDSTEAPSSCDSRATQPGFGMSPWSEQPNQRLPKDQMQLNWGLDAMVFCLPSCKRILCFWLRMRLLEMKKGMKRRHEREKEGGRKGRRKKSSWEVWKEGGREEQRFPALFLVLHNFFIYPNKIETFFFKKWTVSSLAWELNQSLSLSLSHTHTHTDQEALVVH